jgi:hypothetical protein
MTARGAGKGGVALAGVVLGLVLVEAYLRWHAPQPIYAIRYCYLGWCHVPGVSFVHGAETGEFVTAVRYNSRGLRDREYEVAKAPGTRRVAIFGDSFAEGLEVPFEDLHAKRLERALAGCVPGGRVEVLNFGVSAYDTAQEWWYFEREGRQYRPDLVVVIWTGEAGSPFVELRDGRVVFNEPRFGAAETWRRDAMTFVKLHVHTATFVLNGIRATRSVREFQARLTGSAPGAYAIAPDTSPTPFTADWRAQLAIFEAFARAAEASGTRFVVAARSAAEYRYLAASLREHPVAGLEVIDLQPDGDGEARARFFPRDGHWNRAGHAFVADVLAHAIREERMLGPLAC